MEFDQIRSFLEVAQSGSFSRAAEKLFRTQPAVSNQIRLLEEELDEKLFDRIGKRVYLTQAGEMLLSYARKIVELHDEAKLAISELRAEPKGKVSIGANEATCIYILPELFLRFHEKYPKVQISIYRNFTHKIIGKILDNALDFGIVTLPIRQKNLVVMPVHEDELVVITPPEHPLLDRSAVRVDELLKYPLIFHKMGTTRQRLERIFGRHKNKMQIVMEIASIEMMKRFVSIGMGIAVISHAYVREDVKEGKLKALPLKGVRLMRRLGLVYRKDRYLSKAARAFLEVVRESREKTP